VSWDNPVADLAYLYGQPSACGDIRTEAADFVVEEVLGFEPGGEGEHVCLFIEKRGENTQYVAKQVAQIAGARNRDVSYCGLKDRHGVTRQWFSVAVPVKKSIDWSGLNSDSVSVLKQVRHSKKLRTGSHKHNKFEIKVRNISDMTAVKNRFEQVKRAGVPNYFGSQRFGFNGNNLHLAQRMFEGEQIRDRKLRGLVISAARSYLFNLQVSQRVSQQRLTQPMDGDIFRLAGSRSFFSETVSDEIRRRLVGGDIEIAALLPGDGPALSHDDALIFEQQVLAEHQNWVQGLRDMRVDADCRPVSLRPQAISMQVLDDQTVSLSFVLPTGSFATALLRELINVKDCSNKEFKKS
jgi:tRNA pseudouridine13 synthase